MNYTRVKRDCQYRNESIVYTDGTIFNVSTLNILFKHLLPKVLPSIFVIMIVDFGKSFYTLVHYHFRFRCTTTISRVGAMLQAGREFITSHPIMIIAPASLISGTILIFNLTGDAVRDRLLEQRGVQVETFNNKNLNISDKEGQAIIKNVDLNIYNQSLNVIIGESGAGKSLTVKAILNHLPTQLHMSFDEFIMQGQNTSQKQLNISDISLKNYAQVLMNILG